MLGKAVELGCKSESDIECLCSNPDFGNGIRDCTEESCPPGSDANAVLNAGNTFCQSRCAPYSQPNIVNLD